MKEERTDVRFLGASAGHGDGVLRFGVIRGRLLTLVDAQYRRPHRYVRNDNQKCRAKAESVKAAACEGSDHGRAPKCGGSIQPAHVGALAQNHARAEKADAGNDLRRDACRVALADYAGKGHEAGGAERDERIRPQARHFLMPLPFDADGRARDKGGSEAHKNFTEHKDIAHGASPYLAFRGWGVMRHVQI
jgi:hypothetical protein